MKIKLFPLFLLLTSMMYAQFPTNGLMAQYGFDNGMLLVDGANGQNFTQTGTALTEVNDRFEMAPTSAIDLNGDHLTRSNVSSGTVFSISFWLKTTTIDSNTRIIIDDSPRNGPNTSPFLTQGYIVYLQDGRVGMTAGFKYTCSTINRTFRLLATPVIADGNWHHVVISLQKVVSGNTDHVIRVNIDDLAQEVLVNGFSNGSCTLTSNVDTNGNFVVANSRAGNLTSSDIYQDSIDDILLYNRLLSNAEIQSIGTYNNYCFTPQNSILSTSNIMQTTAEVNITGSDTYDIAYHKASEPFSNATILTGITTGQQNLTGLDPSTPYKLYVRKQCAVTTGWSLPVDFRTRGKIYVAASATGNNDGSSWTNAFTDLQSALVNAVDGQEIWLMSGIYKPSTNSRTTYFVIAQENVKIYGGFDGTETVLADRIFGMNETILSGDLQNNDVNTTDYVSNYSNSTRNGDNSYHIINIAGNNALLDGLTIRDAHNNRSTTERGGAIVKNKTVAKLTMKNCIIKDNVSRNDNAALVAEFELNNVGGTRGELNIENCQFINNMSRWGTGVYSFIRSNTQVDINITNSLFDKNIAGDLNNSSAKGLRGSAGWLRNIGNSLSELDVQLVNNTFVNNIDTGTEQSLNNFSRATLVLSKSSTGVGTSNATVTNCIFWDNETAGGLTTRSITDQYTFPMNSVVINNAIDEANFNDDSITSTMNTSNADPLFADVAMSNYTLQNSSPAIDTGDNSVVATTEDLAGNARIVNSTVDMGAYEYDATLSVIDNELAENNVTLYPNPAVSIVTIQTEITLEKIMIYNLLGKAILETKSKIINVSNLSQGIYIMKITSENGAQLTKRFIKQ